MPLAAALAMVLLSNPQLLQRLSGQFQKIFPGQAARGVGQAPMASGGAGGPGIPIHATSQGGFAQTLGARGPLPMGLALAGRLPGIYGYQQPEVTGGPFADPRAFGGSVVSGPGVSARTLGGGEGTAFPEESMTEARNRLARSLLDQYGGDVAKAAAAYQRVIWGEGFY